MRLDSRYAQIVAVLHDVGENTGMSIDELRRRRVPPRIE
jgi:hypothetical protein